MYEGELYSSRSAEEIGDQREIGALDVGEQQRRSTGGNDAAMNLRRFEIGIDGHLDGDEVAQLPETMQERSEIGKGHGARRS